MKTITFTNQKGGVAKTTTAHATASLLTKKGYKVLIVDLDPQGNMTFTLKGKAEADGSLSVLDAPESIAEQIQNTPDGDLLASSQQLALADKFLSNADNKEYRLKQALNLVSDKYDYCIIDTPPSLNILTINALCCADNVVIPLQASIYSVQGLYQLNDTIQVVKEYSNPNLVIKGILITMYESRPTAKRFIADQLEQIADEMQTKVFKTRIRKCIAVEEAQMNLLNVFEYAKKSNAALDYNEFVEELIN